MIQIEQIIAVGGKPGLFKLVSTRSNGLILEDLSNGKVNFYSSRSFQFSPLESIGIYTLSDNLPLKEVYSRCIAKGGEIPPPEQNAPDEEFKKYFEALIPEYDRYRVHARDMKKCLKWYRHLKELGFIKEDPEKSDAKED